MVEVTILPSSAIQKPESLLDLVQRLLVGDRSLLYTGDYNTASTPTTTALQLADLPSADILITESTYGDSSHRSRKTQKTALLSAIASVVQRRGNVLIPAFARLSRARNTAGTPHQ